MPTNLRTEHSETPMGIDAVPPRFSWSAPGKQVAYQISCASAPEILTNPDLWDSGQVESPNRAFIPYAGSELKSGQRVYWRVRSWSSDGSAQGSAPTWFEMGLLNREDWKGQLLSVPCNGGGGRGYLSKSFPVDAECELWAEIDLGKRESFDRIALWAVRCPEIGDVAGTGMGFPVHFRIDGSDEAGFQATELIFETKEDVANPGRNSWEVRLPAAVRFRFVRLTVLNQYARLTDSPDKALSQAQFFGLDEFQIFSGGTNIALGKPVKVPNVSCASIEIGAYDWHPDCLTDGIIHPREVRRDAGGGNLLRRVFALTKPVSRARAYVASKGFYELSINGKKVGDAVLDSAWTVFDKRLLYSTWDCGDLLEDGNNVMTLLVGNGWTLSPAVILQLRAEHPDGTVSELCTDSSWRLLPSPIRENHIFHGEIYDASLENPAVFSSDFDDRSYPFAMVLEGDRPALSAQMQPPIRAVETIAPISLSQPHPGVWVFDMGRNFAGWARIRVPGGDRREVKLRFAEAIFDDGTVWTDPAQTKSRNEGAWADFQKRYILYRDPEDVELDAKASTADGMINVANYRVARATDRFLTSGSAGETCWEPRLLYHGFRFVELTNYPGAPTLEAIRGRVVHTDLRRTGRFECDNHVLTWAWDATQRTLINNLHSVPTDCCQRDERQGWTADLHLACEAMLMNFDAASSYIKWLQDARDSQRADGAFSDTIPYSLGRMGGDVAWAASSLFVAWHAYLHTGDQKILAEHFPAMCRYLDFLENANPDHFANNAQYGEHLSLEESPKELIENAFWYEAARVTSHAAAALGLDDQKARFDAMAQNVAETFHSRLFDPVNGWYGSGSQASNALPLRFGMVPAELRESVFERLVANIEKKSRHLSTGIVATKALLEVLCEYGRADLAFAIASTEEFPGWGYMKNHAATTLWEHWELLTGNEMNSHNHPVFGSIASWMMKYLAGIQPSPEAPGFQMVILAPVFPEGLNRAFGELQTPLGLIRTSWKREGSGVVFEAQLPPGCTGILRLPVEPEGRWVPEGDATSKTPCEVINRFREKLTKRSNQYVAPVPVFLVDFEKGDF